MKVLLAGGGTGGHINRRSPLHPLSNSMTPRQSSSLWERRTAWSSPCPGGRLCPGDHARCRISAQAELEEHQAELQGGVLSGNIQHRAKQILKQFQPDIAIGTGGYVAGPILHAAAHMGIPCAIHEQNAFPGVTNKMLAKEVDHVMLTVEKALDYLHPDCAYTVTGLPVRGGIAGMDRAAARKKLGFDDGMCILSFGGSLGAGCINEAMAKVIPWHTEKGMAINHIHGYGGMGKESFPKAMADAGIPMKSDRLRITEYINDMDVCLAAADLVICRSGASTLAELEAAGRGSILIPSPIVTGNHQLHNANVLGDAGAAIVIEQKDASPERIIQEIEKLYQDRSRLTEMGQNAKRWRSPTRMSVSGMWSLRCIKRQNKPGFTNFAETAYTEIKRGDADCKNW